MATLEELLAEYGLSENTQTKVASEQKTTNEEVDQVLESLGLTGAEEGVEKVASENETKGDNMSLTGIYEELFGDSTSAGEESVEKIASEEVDGNEATDLFGQLTAHYFGVAQGEYFEKVAASVEDEADQDEEQPMAHLGNKSSLGGTLGKQEDPHMAVNHTASGGEGMKVMTGNQSPYSLKELAFLKAVLKRIGKSEAGAVGAYKD
jgi:hypothetical protein